MTPAQTLTVAAIGGLAALLGLLLLVALALGLYALLTQIPELLATHRERRHAQEQQGKQDDTAPCQDVDDQVLADLAAACCDRWWTSCGTDHDHQCTRKDQTT